MHALYDLKEMLCKQLEDYGKKGELSPAILERVDTLAHAAKNVDKLIESYEQGGEYSGARYPVDGGHSMGRGRKRDSMGRYSGDGYSRHGDLTDQLRDMLDDTSDDRTRQELQRLITRLENR